MVDEIAVRVPELPVTKDQLTGRLAFSVTVPLTPAYAADGVTTNPPLVTAAVPVPARFKTVGEPGWFPANLMLADSAAA